MNYLSVDKLTKSYTDKVLFEGITFGIEKGQKVALVGINGTGKSTLLKILAGEEAPDSGSYHYSKSIKFAFLKQEPDVDGHEAIMDYVLSGNDPIKETVRSYFHFLEERNLESNNAILDKMSELNAWDFEAKAKQMLGKLGIHNLAQPVDKLSGGQKKRVALAKVLLEEPDFLILDEPTNHLDLIAIEWLEEYLSKQKISLLLVTHDRYFLQSITNEIIELDNGNLHKYTGTYTQYLEKRLERQIIEQEQASKAKNLLKKEMEWLNRQPQARGTKAKYRIDAVGDLQKKANQVTYKEKMDINLSGKRLGKKILEIDQLFKQFGSTKIVDSFSYTFKRGDRIGIVGKNGIGKSTFLNLISGNEKPDAGKLIVGETVSFGYYHQGGIAFDEEQRVIDAIKEIAEVIQLKDGNVVTASQLLTLFNFSPKKQFDFIRNLSGGEKRRLQLLKVLMANPNFLILDEPTNDFDLDTLSTLEEYLESFEGCILIVSHDRYFMDRLVEHVFAFEGNGSIKDYPGNYTDFRQADLPNKEPESQKSAPQVKKVKTESKKLSFGEKRELEQIEKDLEVLEKEKASILNLLNSNEQDFQKLTDWGKQLQEIESRIEENEFRWLELNENM